MFNKYFSYSISCKESLDILQHMNLAFLEFFLEKDFIIHKKVNICSGIDKSVRFVGSHTSVLKNYMINDTIPEQGFVINQDCFKTKNLELIKKDEQILNVPSFFPCSGILSKYKYAPATIECFLEFFIDFLQFPVSSLEILINSTDRDLVNIFKKSKYPLILKQDTLPKEKYLHQKFGVDHMYGRDCTIALKNSNNSISSIAAITIIERDRIPKFVEITISPLKVISQLCNYNSTFYCYLPSFYLLHNISQSFIKILDCLVSVTVLFRYGLEPSNKDNRTRLFEKYIRYLQQLISKSNFDLSELQFIQNQFEDKYFSYGKKVTNKVMLSILKNTNKP